MTGSIVDLEEAVASLPAAARAAAGRIFAISTTVGRLDPPPEMHEWIKKLFGSVEAVREQRIVRVNNHVTLEGALFNELRALRPMEVKGADEVRATIASSANDPFCRPRPEHPADTFGRVEGAHGITASNVAKYDGFHGVLVFKEHDPLAPMDARAIRDHLVTARRWARARARGGPRGALLLPDVEQPVARGWIDRPRSHADDRARAACTTRRSSCCAVRRSRTTRQHGSDYFDDLWVVHEALGLGAEGGWCRARSPHSCRSRSARSWS